MADPDKGTDGTPIKPVSSLRSHFENMASLKPSPRGQVSHAPSQAPSQTPIHRTRGQRDNHGLERNSLDIERRPSPVFSPRNLVINDPQIGARMPIDLKSLPQPIILPSRQRPLSMISLSSLQCPPTVTVDAPLSPQKPFVMPKARLPSRSPTPSPSRVNEMRTHLQHAVPTPPGRSATASPVREMERLSAANRNNLPSSRLLPGDTNINHSRLATDNGPPPVRRAEKPKIPIKPTASKSSTNLETNPIVSTTRASPFSTPSSSDDNLGAEAARSRSPLSMAKSERESQLQQASTNHNSSEQKFSDNGDFHHSLLNSEAPPKVKPHLSSLLNDLPTSRPGLPPRPDPDKRPAQSPRSRPVSMLNRNRPEQNSRQESFGLLTKPRIPSGHSQTSVDGKYSRPEFMPPPRRPETSITTGNRRNEADDWSMSQDASQGLSQVLDINDTLDPEAPNNNSSPHPYPDTSNLNRRPPYLQQGVQKIDVNYDTKLFDVSSRYICTTGLVTRAWDFSGSMVLNLGHDERDIRVTALAFKPGAALDDEGLRIWLGTNYGDIQEVDIPSQTVYYTKSAAHNRREILKIYRYQNSMWTLDDDGRLYIWPAGEEGLPSLQLAPKARRVPRGHSFSLIIQDTLWIATGKEIRVFRPLSKDDAGFCVTKQALSQYGVGEVTSGAVVAGRLHCVYFGHTDGKVTSYSIDDFSCLGVFNVSVYKINSLIGACSYLWAGFNSGTICVYDTSTQPWTTKKEWQAHPDHPVSNILVERSSLWKSGSLRVASIGMDNTVRFWDGMLEQDWLETAMQTHDTDYCSFREIKTVVVTWNAGASTPASLRYDDNDISSFREVLHVESPPEILVFGFQELVDLDDKKLTARSIFKGNKKKDASEQEHMSRKYTAWCDFLVRFIEDNMPHDEPYQRLHTASMMGLFSCVFVKASQHRYISNVCTAEIKRGLGGLHGNKGAIILRFMLDDTSVCFVNCHLAAGQSQTVHRHNDAAAILESAILPPERDQSVRCDSFVGGGDGTMILDHEICILNGDLNYRIDTMGRDTVIKAVKAKNFSKLLERDQLLVARRRTPGFRLRVFAESQIFFAPTYKYDVGSDNYDSSEKHRAPAWCDRILYRGSGKIKQLEYRRHEVQVSDHRPVSGSFKMRIKTVSPDTRVRVWESCVERLEAFRQKASHEAKIEYLRDVLGVDANEAKKLISQRV